MEMLQRAGSLRDNSVYRVERNEPFLGSLGEVFDNAKVLALTFPSTLSTQASPVLIAPKSQQLEPPNLESWHPSWIGIQQRLLDTKLTFSENNVVPVFEASPIFFLSCKKFSWIDASPRTNSSTNLFTDQWYLSPFCNTISCFMEPPRQLEGRAGFSQERF